MEVGFLGVLGRSFLGLEKSSTELHVFFVNVIAYGTAEGRVSFSCPQNSMVSPGVAAN